MVISPNSPWNNALSLIRANVSEQVYNTWFKKIGFESYDDKTKTVILQVPSHFVCEYLEENYVGLLGKALRQNFCPEVGLKYRLVAEKKVAAVEAEPQTTANQTGANVAAQTNEAAAQPNEAAQPVAFDSQLNPDQTFDNYIEGVCNKLARTVGSTQTEQPNPTHNNQIKL